MGYSRRKLRPDPQAPVTRLGWQRDVHLELLGGVQEIQTVRKDDHIFRIKLLDEVPASLIPYELVQGKRSG